MATLPPSLIWEIVKKNNSFMVTQFAKGKGRVQFSRERNNLYNIHSFKHSGLANKKTVTIQPGGGEKELSVLLATTKSKKLNKPSDMLHKYVMKKNFRRMSKIVESQVSDNKYRPDLKKAALARLSYVYQSLLAAKNGIRKQRTGSRRVRRRRI